MLNVHHNKVCSLTVKRVLSLVLKQISSHIKVTARNFPKQDGNPYNGPSAIMVKVKPVGQDWQNGLVGQNCYSQDIN